MTPRPPGLDVRLGMTTYLTSGGRIRARIRERIWDFIVDEVVSGVRASRAFLRIASLPGRGSYSLIVAFKLVPRDTRWVAQTLSREFRGRISYAGLKDTRAVVFQYFSVSGRVPGYLELEGLKLRRVGASPEPLSRGSNEGNHFTVVVRGERPGDLPDSFPNYFSYQRFGVTPPYNHEIGRALLLRDVASALEMLAAQGHDVSQVKSIKELSERVGSDLLRFLVHSYQSYLFNLLLSRRLEEGPLLPVEGDVVVSEDGGLATHPTPGDLALPLPGAWTKLPDGWTRRTLDEILKEEGISPDMFLFSEVPEISALGSFRRALSKPKSVTRVDFSAGTAISFFLESGSYATSFLREIIKPSDPIAQGFP